MALLGLVAKVGAGMLKGRKKKQTGAAVAAKVVGKKEPTPVPQKENPQISFDSPVASASQNISKSKGRSTSESLKDTALRIKFTTIEVNTLLKGSLALDKMQEKNKIKTKEKLKRTKAEDELEKDNKGKLSLPIPGAKKVASFWERIKKFFITMFWGMIAMKLLPLLPKLIEILPKIAAVAEWIIGVGIGVVNILAGAIKIGYDAYDWTRKQVKDKLGEGAAQKFDSFMGVMNKVMNLFVVLGLAAGKMRGPKGSKGPKGPKRGAKNKLKRFRKKLGRRFDPKRADKLKRIKNIKRIKQARKLAAAKKAAAAKKFARLRKVAGAKKVVGQTTQRIGQATQKVGQATQKVGQFASKTTQKVGGALTKAQGAVGKTVTRLGMRMNKGMVQSMKGLSKMAKGVRIPIVGPILAALTSYLAEGKWDKALFIGVGTALGELLGTAIPIPVLGTLLGGAIGFYVGDLLYTLFRGGGAGAVVNKLKNDLLKILNAGKAVAQWVGAGFSRFWQAVPKFKVPDFPEEPPKWIPGFGFGSKKKIWNAFKTGLKVLIGPLSLLMGKEIPNLLWLMNPVKTVPALIKSFFPPGGEKTDDSIDDVGSGEGDDIKYELDEDDKKEQEPSKDVQLSKFILPFSSPLSNLFKRSDDGPSNKKKLLFAISTADSDEAIMNAIKTYAPYEQPESELVMASPVASDPSDEGSGEPGEVRYMPVPTGGGHDPYEILYKGS